MTVRVVVCSQQKKYKIQFETIIRLGLLGIIFFIRTKEQKA